MWPLSASTQGAPTPPDHVKVLIKFAPVAGTSAHDKVRFLSESCPACLEEHDPAYERFNARESVLYLKVPRGRALDLSFVGNQNDMFRAIVNNQDLRIHRQGMRVTVELPPLTEDAIWAPAFETDLAETGMVLRFEHADPLRRAGPYAEGPFPVRQRSAANNLSFAMREVVRLSGLGSYVENERIGKIMIMGFDTNFPADHEDDPPHVHMHLRWPNNIGTQIGHFYLNTEALFTENKVGIRGLGAPQRRFGLSQTFTTIDNQGRTVYSHTITPEGWLRIDTATHHSCLLKPVGMSFDEGVLVACAGLPDTRVYVKDDLVNGIITAHIDEVTETYRYDTDTGYLLTQMAPPLLPLSAINP